MPTGDRAEGGIKPAATLSATITRFRGVPGEGTALLEEIGAEVHERRVGLT